MIRSHVSRLGTLSGMELPIDLLRELAADALDLRQVFHARAHDAFQAAEPRQELFTALGAHSCNTLERRRGPALGAPSAVSGDCKAVCFVPDSLDQVQPGVVGRKPHGALADPQLLEPGLALGTLRDTDEGDIREPDLGQGFVRRADLPLAAVDENRIRRDPLAARDSAV